MKLAAARLLFAAAFLALWQWGGAIPLIGQLPILDPFIVSTPADVARQIMTLHGRGSLLPNVGYTLLATVGGLAGGLVTGFAAALALSNAPTLRRILDPFVTTLNAIPRIVLAPYLLIAFGIGVTPRMIMAASFVFFIVFFNVLHGISRVSSAQVEHVVILGGGRRNVLVDLHLPVALAWTLRAFPQAVAYAFVGTVFQEFVGGDSGLGSIMIYGLNDLSAATVMATIVLLAALGMALVTLGEFVGSRIVPWRAELSA